MMELKSLKKFAIPSNITTYLSQWLIIITVATTLLVGGILIVQQTFYFREISEQRSNDFIDYQKVHIKEVVKNELEYIRQQDEAFRERIKSKIKSNVSQAFHLAESIYRQYEGRKTEQEIKSLIIASVSSLKFNHGFEEVFISTENGTGVFYPRNPEFSGKDMWTFKDENGFPVIREEINLLKEKTEGFLEYEFESKLKNKTLPNKKVTFVKKFGRFDWYFGSKQYVNDFFREFREEVAQKISSVRFRHGGYIFMNSVDGTPIVMDGKVYRGDANLLQNADSAKQNVFLMELDIANNKPDGDFFYYKWNKMDETELSEKCAFCQVYQPYGWIIGAGFYLDEIEKSILDQQTQLKRDQQKSILLIVFVVLLLLVVEAIVIYHFNKKYKADFDRFFQFFLSSSKSFDKLDVGHLYFDEFKKAGAAANEMIGMREEIEKKLIEEQKRATESDRLKSAFLANMSHEIRTPMNAIIGFSELLDDDTHEPDDKKEFVKHIRKNGEILLHLLNDIIDISKIEANLLSIKKRSFSLNKFMDDVEQHYHGIIASKKGNDVTFSVVKYSVENCMVTTDQMRLRQILDNLIGNAIKFTSKGQIKVEVKLVEDVLHVSVADTGIGISPKHQKTIFERFIQAEHGHNVNYGGTGLGLAISKNLAELLGGHIGVESEPGKGSTFYFSVQAN
jgi:signal transduction histidine kinase